MSSRFSLRWVLVVPFLVQISIAVGLTGYLSIRNGERAIRDLATQLRAEVTARASERLQTLMIKWFKKQEKMLNASKPVTVKIPSYKLL